MTGGVSKQNSRGLGDVYKRQAQIHGKKINLSV